MDLMSAIFIRKSIRTYNKQPVAPETLTGLESFLNGLELPFSGIEWKAEVLSHDAMRNLVGHKRRLEAPYYLVLRSEKIRGCLQNAGFFGEMAVLYLTARGIATCWQGGLECENDSPDALAYIAAVAFGYSSDAFRTTVAEFKRKQLHKIYSGDLNAEDSSIVEAARLAPSGMGLQPCRFRACGGRINIYRKSHTLRFPAISYMQCLDVGVAIAHLDIAAKAAGHGTRIELSVPEPELPGLIYQATFVLENQP